MEKNNLPIGVIDSGKGGVGVIHYLSFSLKNEDFLFYLDHDNFPYGNKSRKEIIDIGFNAIEVLKEKSKMIVVACNTLSCYLDVNIDKTIYKINECIVEKLLKIKRKKKVLFLTTSLTKKSNYFQNECEKHNIEYNIISCPKLVDMVENDKINYDKVLEILKEEFNKNYNIIVLGCTHFYYLEEHIKKIFPKTKIVTGYDVLLKKINKDLKKHKLKNIKQNSSSITIVRN